MVIQYFIVTIIVFTVLVWQYKTYKDNETIIDKIKNLFPSSNTTTVVVDENSTRW